ncbi:Sialic acid TRAP transporter permease protein SiaT [Marinomonas spartinae]|uniref:TRAP transporter small permease protein n=1 Tax=Marinomonas spartinae TaxID=1792290 RepID=A0A1A8T0C0_9GAMM|nr:TRAP transporter small permease [Marinomonas spartinae]SBS25281.1 Sialic acid TRAP transporter permease protein SiaT [Marinomonas spartinae]
MFNKISRYIYRLEVVLSQIVLSLIVALVFCSAVSRSLGYPIIWSIEIAKILFMLICFLCVDITLKKKQHIGITYLVEKLSEKTQNIIQLLVLILMLGFTLFSISRGMELIQVYRFRMFNATGIPYRYVMPIIPISMFLMSITIMAQIETCIKKIGCYKFKEEKAEV